MANNVKPADEQIVTDSLPEVDDIELDDDLEKEFASPELEQIELVLPDSICGERLDKVLSKLVPQYSRARMQKWIEEGNVTVDGAPSKIKTTMLGGEKILIQPQVSPEDCAFSAEDIPLNIVFEDDHLIVLNKPAGLVVHPAAGNWSGTLLNGLLFHRPGQSSIPRAGIVHRLDKDTSGLMVVAKTLTAQTELVRQLQARTVSREYYALVWGQPNISGTIDAAIARHHRDRLKMAVSQSMFAKPAVTHYQRVATGNLEKFPVSLVSCKLETGRTHQIRAHMLSLGFPLVGDTLYGKQHLARFFHRQALQAWRLGLNHPATGDYQEWRIPLEADFAELLQQAAIEQPEV
ncbi:RluA family pseudouridine synthase [Undibacterium cyanobacteriorum]|uniref:Pseudouridine synthase n=1 Tax=Undibacterium cyanobacteriorum TaxID=3073561 RepID=A0ABY9RCI9_9BURK|nr:RluA family pseudouridine synthase [Undibacterium sp. 20NA77.5]WMW78968.1 RluA family pseudouridine synthase [Undibacterium sp. 20NA77.5]